MANNIATGIEQAYKERTDLLVVALTGRTGSGCTTTADILSKQFAEISISPSDFPETEKRKISIAERYCAKNWVPFKKISVSTLILSFLLEESDKKISDYFSALKLPINDGFFEILKSLRQESSYSSFVSCIKNGEKDFSAEAWDFYSEKLIQKSNSTRKILGAFYAPIFQTLGDNIRFSGKSLSKEVNANELFTLIRQVKRLAKSAFVYDRKKGFETSTRIVIDAVRNPLELVYLRDQFAAFYSIAITTEDSNRVERLEELGLNKKQIRAIDEKEYSSTKKYLDSYENFVSQNLQDCIQKSDIFFANPGPPSDITQNIRHLNAQILRYSSLMLRPGLITPTRDERCMQLAFVAKANSGCISRQVGAAVADENYSIKSVGWNDVPKGQVPCLLRDVEELLTGGDKDAFSIFEKTDKKFATQIKQTYLNRRNLKDSGLPCPYCFKSEYNKSIKERNQVHTRSLHAEENAFLQLAKYGNSGINKGFLFTTASPCELCSKKAFQLGINEIIYVDPYPGISSSHVLSSGDPSLRPKLRLFSGAIGQAYHRLYDSILPIKDEYMARLLADDSQRELL